MKTAKILNWQPKHIVTMINFNWGCVDCGYENSSSLSEEEDLMQHDFITQTCAKCRYNNRIKVSAIYK